MHSVAFGGTSLPLAFIQFLHSHMDCHLSESNTDQYTSLPNRVDLSGLFGRAFLINNSHVNLAHVTITSLLPY
jgi:hypothetical protein